MLQMKMEADGKEQILDLVDVPEFVLVQSCYMTLKYQDLRNPDAQYILRETINALKVKAEAKPGEPYSLRKQDLKDYITRIEDLLNSIDQD